MHCIEVKNILDAPDGVEAVGTNQPLRRHIAGCDDCREYARDRQLIGLLASLPVPAPAPGFEDRVVMNALTERPVLSERRVRQEHGASGTDVHLRWALATAASVLVAIVLTLQLRPAGITPSNSVGIQKTAVEIRPGQLRMVNVMLASPRRMEGALITVRWDSNLKLDGYEGLTRLQWRADLKDGHNQLTLPVQLVRGRSGSLTVTVEHEGASKHFSVQVNAVGDNGRAPDQAMI